MYHGIISQVYKGDKDKSVLSNWRPTYVKCKLQNTYQDTYSQVKKIYELISAY